jgi:hypothetical protein
LLLAQQFTALDGVEQLEAQVPAAVGQPADRTAEHGVHAARAPLGGVDAAVLVQRHGRGLDAEQPAALQVGAHDGGNRQPGGRFVAEVGHRQG